MGMRRFELVAGKSAKFWEVGVKGAVLTVRYGRIGSKGRTLTKELESATTARAERDRLIRQKEGKGYTEMDDAQASSGKASKRNTPKAKGATKRAAAKRGASKKKSTSRKKGTSKKARRTSAGAKALLARLETALAKNAPDVLAGLHPGASAQKIARLKKAVDVPLPEVFCEWLRWRDGSCQETRWLNGDYSLSCESIAGTKRMMDEIVAEGHYSDFREDEYWSSSWVPFVDDDMGYSGRVLDTRGCFTGQAGQIVWAAAKSPERIVQAGSFEDWLELIVAVYERELFEVEDECVLFDIYHHHPKILPGYPKEYEPGVAAAPADDQDLQRPTLGKRPKGIPKSARWLVQPNGEKVKHWLVALSERRRVKIWRGNDVGALKENTKTAKTAADAKKAVDAALRKKVSSGFTYLNPSRGRGACRTVMQLNTAKVALAGDGRTLAYGVMGHKAKSADLYLADLDTGRRKRVRCCSGTGQYFVHWVGIDAADEPLWMVNHETRHIKRQEREDVVVADIRRPGKHELFNPHVSQSELSLDGRRLLTFGHDGIRVWEAGRALFKKRVKPGSSEYRHGGISPSGKRIAVVRQSRYVIYRHEDAKRDSTNEIHVFDVDGGGLTKVPMPDVASILRIGISHDDREVLLSDYNVVRGIDIATGEVAWAIPLARVWAYSPDGSLLAIAQRGARVTLLDAKTRERRQRLQGGLWTTAGAEIHESQRLVFARDQSRLVQVCGGRLYAWQL